MSESEPTTPLIRTGLRDKLPPDLSHPVGTESISRALAGCPQYEELWIAFGSRALPLHPVPKELEGYQLAFSAVRSEGWHLGVPAVPSASRSLVRQLLEVAGLPGVREWLLKPHSGTGQEGTWRFQVGYTTEPPAVCFVESVDRRVVDSSVREVPEVGS